MYTLGLTLSLSVVSSTAALANDDFLVINQRNGNQIGVLNEFPGVANSYLWMGGQWARLGAVIHDQAVVWGPGSTYGVLRPDATGTLEIALIDFSSRRPVWVSLPQIPGTVLNASSDLELGRLANGTITVDVLVDGTWMAHTRQGGWRTVTAGLSTEAQIDVHDGMACVAEPGVDEVVVNCDYAGLRLSGGTLSTDIVPAPGITDLSVFEVMPVQQWAVLNWETATTEVGAAVDMTGASFDAPTFVDIVSNDTVYYTDRTQPIYRFWTWEGPGTNDFMFHWAGIGQGPTFMLGQDGRYIYGINERAGALGSPFFVN